MKKLCSNFFRTFKIFCFVKCNSVWTQKFWIIRFVNYRLIKSLDCLFKLPLFNRNNSFFNEFFKCAREDNNIRFFPQPSIFPSQYAHLLSSFPL